MKSVVIPYIRGLSEALKRILTKSDIRVVYQPHSTLRRQLVRVKDSLPSEKKSGVVYSIPCSSCPSVYIGQTGRCLGVRIEEHRAAIRHAQTEVSAVAEHVWVKHHQMDLKSTTILAQESNPQKRCFLESWFIQRHLCMNREIGSLVSIYKCLF